MPEIIGQCKCCEGYGYHELDENTSCGEDNEIIDDTRDCDACKGSGVANAQG